MWPNRKTNKMADADGTAQSSISSRTSSAIATLMNYLGFIKMNFENIPYAPAGSLLLGINSEGKITLKDQYGNIIATELSYSDIVREQQLNGSGVIVLMEGANDPTASPTGYIAGIDAKTEDLRWFIISPQGEKTYLSSGGGGLEGTAYIYVAGAGTPSENATELQAAYDNAVILISGGLTKITLIVSPGEYEFPANTPFTVQDNGIDVVSLTGNRDVYIYKISSEQAVSDDTNNIIISSSNAFIKGIDASRNVWVLDGTPIEKSGADSFSYSYDNSIPFTGKLYFCRLTSGAFRTLTAPGLIRGCIDGNNVWQETINP